MKKYTTGKKLGEGSFATVHLCVEKTAPKGTYAVKIIEKSKCVQQCGCRRYLSPAATGRPRPRAILSLD